MTNNTKTKTKTKINNEVKNEIKCNKENINIVYDYIKKKLTNDKLQELSNKCNSINIYCKGDGCGLSSGILIDMFITNFLKNELDKEKYEIFHKGESDMKICNIPLSFKKITGKACIALDWSKNKDEFKKDYFTNDIIIMNMKSGQWWKNENNQTIYAGLYFINKEYCKKNIILSSNNKTNSLINNESVYFMLLDCIQKNKFIKIPESNAIYKFDILNAFTL